MIKRDFVIEKKLFTFSMITSYKLVFDGQARAQTTNTLPPLYRQINREDRLVVREGVCVLGRKGRRRLSYLHTHLPP